MLGLGWGPDMAGPWTVSCVWPCPWPGWDLLGPVVTLPPVHVSLKLQNGSFICVSLPMHGIMPQETQLLPCEASGQSVAITIFCSLVRSDAIVFILCVCVCVCVCADSFKNFPGRIKGG